MERQARTMTCLSLQAHRVPTSVGIFSASKSPTKVGTLNTVNESTALVLDPSQHNPPVAFPPRNTLTVQIFQQRNRILARDTGQLFESSDVNLAMLRAVRAHLSGEIVQHRPMKKHFAMNFDQHVRFDQQLQNLSSLLGRDARAFESLIQARRSQTRVLVDLFQTIAQAR